MWSWGPFILPFFRQTFIECPLYPRVWSLSPEAGQAHILGLRLRQTGGQFWPQNQKINIGFKGIKQREWWKTEKSVPCSSASLLHLQKTRIWGQSSSQPHPACTGPGTASGNVKESKSGPLTSRGQGIKPIKSGSYFSVQWPPFQSRALINLTAVLMWL